VEEDDAVVWLREGSLIPMGPFFLLYPLLV